MRLQPRHMALLRLAARLGGIATRDTYKAGTPGRDKCLLQSEVTKNLRT